MAQVALDRGGAVAGKGTLWAKVDNEGQNTITLKKAFFFALWVEAAMIVGFFSIDFSKRWDDIRDSKIMKAITPEIPKPPEEKKEEPPPPPPPPKKPDEKPKENIQEAAPILVDAPLATSSGSATAVSVPQAVGDVQQGKGTMTEPPPPTPQAGPRTVASITNKKDCFQAFLGRYPKEARRAGIEGELVALATIAPDGTATNVVITEANPRGTFDRVVISVLTNVCKFAPDPKGYHAQIPIAFKLSGESTD
jgi:periplasmic protein TonB